MEVSKKVAIGFGIVAGVATAVAVKKVYDKAMDVVGDPVSWFPGGLGDAEIALMRDNQPSKTAYLRADETTFRKVY